jgi:hypothetical protein
MKEFKEISDKSPFRVPDNYFEEVNRKIILSASLSVSEHKKESIYRKLKPYFAVAASVAVLVVLSYVAIHSFYRVKDKSVLPEVTLSEFTDNYLDDIDILTLEESTLSIEPDVARANIDSKDIIDYLLLENIDINDIYEQL